MSAAENTDKLSLTVEDSDFIESEGNAEEMNVENLAGMLDDNGETLPRLSELDVAFEIDEVEMVEEEPWDDNDSIVIQMTVEPQRMSKKDLCCRAVCEY